VYTENIANWGYLRCTKSSLNTRKVFKRIWRIRRENLCVHGEDAKRLLAYSPNTPKDIIICISLLIINNTNFKNFWILSIYTLWDGFSQKTISCYCPFKMHSQNIVDGICFQKEFKKDLCKIKFTFQILQTELF
jgi:hypothetical protein